MPDEYLDDDGGLSSDFMFAEAVPDGTDVHPQALWVGIRPGYGPDNEQLTEPTIWVLYQEQFMNAPLTGCVAVSPEGWDKIDAAVRWRLAEWKRIREAKHIHPADHSTGPDLDATAADKPAYIQPELPYA